VHRVPVGPNIGRFVIILIVAVVPVRAGLAEVGSKQSLMAVDTYPGEAPT
jgi:hypothetical protein